MQKNILLIVLLFFICQKNLYSQRNSKSETLDSGSICVWYSLNYIEDTTKKTIKTDVQLLEIGTVFSKYHSYLTFRSDSLVNEWRKKNPQASAIPNVMGLSAGQSPIRVDIFKNHTTQKIDVHVKEALIPTHKFLYSEDIPTIDWQIHEDTLTVSGYVCQKAVTRFRGRDYVAWFALDFPVSNGPWKFGGLPGLILKVYDSLGHYTFECVGIKQPKNTFPIYGNNLSGYSRSANREDFLKLEREMHEKPVTTAARLHGVDPSRISARSPNMTFPYNPLELE